MCYYTTKRGYRQPRLSNVLFLCYGMRSADLWHFSHKKPPFRDTLRGEVGETGLRARAAVTTSRSHSCVEVVLAKIVLGVCS